MAGDIDDDLHPLRAYRKRHGLTLKQFAARLGPGTGHSTLVSIERGLIEQPGFELIRRYAAATGGEVSEVRILLWHHRRAARLAAAA